MAAMAHAQCKLQLCWFQLAGPSQTLNLQISVTSLLTRQHDPVNNPNARVRLIFKLAIFLGRSASFKMRLTDRHNNILVYT
ncbi:hypothetical protein BDR03DRAFT_943996 [Suillus americanus]|nr:hypothetical protein BDR03DRAFT_943996 [Suillus americanus]